MYVESLQIAISDAINKCDNWLTHSWTKIYNEMASSLDTPKLQPTTLRRWLPVIITSDIRESFALFWSFFLRYCVLETLTHDVHDTWNNPICSIISPIVSILCRAWDFTRVNSQVCRLEQLNTSKKQRQRAESRTPSRSAIKNAFIILLIWLHSQSPDKKIIRE